MSRPARIALVVATACLGGPATASACLLQGGGANPIGYGPDTPAHAGDPMQFTISKLDEGATYTVTIGGRVIADHVEKTAAGLGEVKRTFRLPDYGPAPRTLAVSVYVFHEGGGSSHEETLDDFLPPSDPLRYEPAVAARPTPAPEAPAGAPDPSGGLAADAAPTSVTAPAPAGTVAARAQPPAVAQPRGGRPATARNLRAAQGTAGVAKPAAGPQHAPLAHARVGDGPRVTVVAVAHRPAAPAHRHVREAPARVGVASPLRAVPAHERVGDPKTLSSRPPFARNAPRAAGREPRAPVVAIVVLALLTVLATGGLGWAIRRQPRPAGEPTEDVTALAIEAELQEIIAEHRVGEGAPAPPTPAAR